MSEEELSATSSRKPGTPKPGAPKPSQTAKQAGTSGKPGPARKAGKQRQEDGDVVHLPRRRRRGLRRLIAAASVVVVLALVLVLLYLTPLLSVHSVSVKGTRLADPAKLQALLKPLEGEPVARVSSDKVKSLLSSEPAVQDIRLGLDSSRDLVVTVIEHREVAVLEQGGKDYLVGDNGAKLKRLSSAKDRKLPLVKLTAQDPDGKIFDTVVQALSQLPAEVLAQLTTAGAGSVDTVQFTLTDGRTVVWGDASEGAFKAADLQALLADGGPKDKTIDVSTPSKPVTR